MWWIALAWIALACALAPIIGRALAFCNREPQWKDQVLARCIEERERAEHGDEAA